MIVSKFLSFILLCLTVTCIRSARILAVFPTPSISHQVVFRPLTLELARRGHDVVVITTDPAFPNGNTPSNFTEVDVHDLSYSMWNKVVSEMDDSSRDSIRQVNVLLEILSSIFKKQIETKSVQNLLSHKNDHFDLLLIEACIRPALGLSYVFKVPVILISSLGSVVDNPDVIGSTSHPILYPSIIRDRLYNLTMWEKVVQLTQELRYRKMLIKQVESNNEVMKSIFGTKIPSLHELYENVAMLFLNAHPVWENNRPVPPGVIYMGGLHQKPAKELPKDLKTYLDSSKNGVIYFSLGTNVKPSHLPSEKLQAIIKVFSRLPYDVLWKWDNDELPQRSNNIKISKWLPQSDLLNHPGIKLFITQGGLQSTDEAITAGVPLIGIPMLVDQWYNVEKYVYHKIGLRLDIDTLTEETLEQAILSIINDKSYRQNIARLRQLMQDQPQKPLERAVWWTEYVLRHGGARHLRSPSANMSWAVYLELELILIIVTISILSIVILCFVSKVIWNFIQLNVPTIVKIKIA